MDYNKEKMIDRISTDVSNNVSGLHDMHDEDEKAVEARIYIETIGKLTNIEYSWKSFNYNQHLFCCRTTSAFW